jgi:vibriolysin
MTYGDGDGVYFGPLTTLDITGHELTHGITERTANLTYSGESGALNEGISDIFGALSERYGDGSVSSSDTWKIGEDAYTPGVSGDALRYMNDPADDGYSYDYYSSSIATGAVHYTSGLTNLAFYLMSEGGAHPTRGGSAVTGMGADAAAAIWYRALTYYMTSSTNFSGARSATLSAATDLYGSTSSQYSTVDSAWNTVGVVAATTSSCTYTNSAGSLSGSKKSYYEPSNSSFSTTTTKTIKGALTGPSSADFDLYLYKYSNKRWSAVASSTSTTSTESISYNGSAATYRFMVYSYSGSGSYTFCGTW